LSQSGATDWLVDNERDVMWVLHGEPTPWYNSSLEAPVVDYDVKLEEYSVVEVVTIIQEINPEVDFIMVEDSRHTDDYDTSTKLVTEHPHKYLVVWTIDDHLPYLDKIGSKVKRNQYSHRILVWAGKYKGKDALILSNEYYE
jgi:hypothetical protein